MKTSELQGAALDWAVAKCEGVPEYFNGEVWIITGSIFHISRRPFSPITKWSQGGPIIEREEITVKHVIPAMRDAIWQAFPSISAKGAGGKCGIGPTPLIAAMRCYVASKLGDEVEIPEELL